MLAPSVAVVPDLLNSITSCFRWLLNQSWVRGRGIGKREGEREWEGGKRRRGSERWRERERKRGREKEREREREHLRGFLRY